MTHVEKRNLKKLCSSPGGYRAGLFSYGATALLPWPALAVAIVMFREQLREQFAFLAIVLDAYSRRVIGWALEEHLRASLAVSAIEMAIKARNPVPGSLIHHSDRGVQYACDNEYMEVLSAHEIQPSMSRVGNPYDNAKAESFMKTLKQEEVDGRNYRDLKHACEAIGVFIEDVYNRQRLHSALGYRPPAEFETMLPPVAAYPRSYQQTAPAAANATGS